MSKDPLPRRIDVRKLAAAGAFIDVMEPLAAFPRVVAQLLSDQGSVAIELAFASDDQHRRIIRGRLRATLQVPCQRCLEAMQLPIDSSFAVGVVRDDEAARQLPRELEPYIVEDAPHDLHDLVEDELLLSLPYTSYHPEDECSASSHFSCGEPEEDAPPVRKENPFQQLGRLKPGKSDH